MAPFGLPVVPLVKCSSAISSGRVASSDEITRCALAIAASRSTALRHRLAGSPPTINTWRRLGRAARTGATFFL